MDDDKTISFSTSEQPALSMNRVQFLLVMNGPEAGRRLSLAEGSLTLGRRDEADVRVDDKRVSGSHCRIIVGGERVFVEDLGSTNGTFVDRVKVEGIDPLPVGSVLQIGNTLLAHECRSVDDLLRTERMQNELDRARDYVRTLLPEPIGEGNITCSWRFAPSEVLGGDAFGYHWLDADRFVVYLLDVCGHGARAALHSVSVMNILRRRALRSIDFTKPEQVLDALNVAFPMEEFAGMYFTIWYGVYDVPDRTLTYGSAGHPPALLVGAGEAKELRTPAPGIGMFADASFSADTVAVPRGSRLYLFSDGAFEIRTPGGRDWTLEDLLGLLSAGPTGGEPEVARVEAAVRALIEGEMFEDDFSLLLTDFA